MRIKIKKMEDPKEPKEQSQPVDESMYPPVPDLSPKSRLQWLETENDRLSSKYLDLQVEFKAMEESLKLAEGEESLNKAACNKLSEEKAKLVKKRKESVSEYKEARQKIAKCGDNHIPLLEIVNAKDDRAKVVEGKAEKLEAELKRVKQEIDLYVSRAEKVPVGVSKQNTASEESLLNDLVASTVNKNEAAETALTYLKANSGVASCRKLLEIWNYLKPETQDVIALAGQVWAQQKDKEQLRTNLRKAEEEVKVLSVEHDASIEENVRLLELNDSGEEDANSDGMHDDTDVATTSNKRKRSPEKSSPEAD